MLKKSVETALNKQINRELNSAYLYLSMSACFESMNMKGFAHWLRVQSKEEQSHAMKFYDYVIAKGGTVILGMIEAPKAKWKSPQEAFADVLAHEQKVTGFINDLVDIAIKEEDHATNNFLQWFVKEQVEEEENAVEILSKIKMIGDAPGILLFLDHELSKRE